MRIGIRLTICTVFILTGLLFAVPTEINYQGKLTDDIGVALDGAYDLTFRIFNHPTAAGELWSEAHSAVPVTKGLFDVILGSSNPINLPFDVQYYIEIRVGGETMSPRLPLTSVGYSFRAAIADSVVGGGGGGGVTQIDEGTGIILTPDPIIATGSVAFDQTWGDARYSLSTHSHNLTLTGDITGSGVVTGSIATDIAGDAVGSSEIADGAVAWGDLSSPVQDSIQAGGGSSVSISQGTGIICSPNPITGTGSVSVDMAWGDGRYVNEGQADAITSSMIVNGTITASDINDGACLAEILDDDGTGSGLDADMVDGLHASDLALVDHTHCGQTWSCADSGLYIDAAVGYALWGTTTDSAFAGVRGDGGAESAGVYGTSSNPSNGGVVGIGTGTDGVYGASLGYLTAGVRGDAPVDTVGWGVYGIGDGRDGAVFGVIAGFSGSWYTGTAITGLSPNIGGVFSGDTTASSWGCFTQTADEDGIALRARSLANATSGTNYAVFATCSTGTETNVLGDIIALGTGVYAANYSDSGNAIIGIGNDLDTITVLTGGAGVTGNGSNVGVFGHGDNTAGSYGVIARSEAADGIGVQGADSDLTPPGGITNGAGGVFYSDNIGVFGWGDATTQSYGVYGTSDDEDDGWGVVGIATTGVQGEGNSTTATNIGVVGYAHDYGSGADVGVYGTCENTGADWAGYFIGDINVTGLTQTVDLFVSGSKTAIIKEPDGWHAVYCQESPEVWFEDFGSGQLRDGKSHIRLAKDFLNIITVNNEHPMKVFVQLTDPNCNGVAVVKHQDGFEVVELGGGTSNATFDWRLVAKRKGYEDYRYELVPKASLPVPERPIGKSVVITDNRSNDIKSVVGDVDVHKSAVPAVSDDKRSEK